MKLKLKEQPKEWRNFALVWCAALALLTWLLVRKGWAPAPVLPLVLVLAVVGAVLALAVPRLFRTPYRAVMTASFHMGQVMGRVILTAIWLAAVTPMALLLHVLGKDLLELKRQPGRESFWKPARKIGTFEQQF